MELYTLDGLLRRTEIVEGFESFIWTERYSDLGEMQIVLPATQQNRNLLPSGTYLGLSESRRVMRVETIENAGSETGEKTLTVLGKEISSIFKDRVATTATAGVAAGTWTSTGRPSAVIRNLFDYVCRNGTSGAGNQLPLLVPGSLYSAGNLPEDVASYVIERKRGDFYAAIKEIADVWDLGFRLYRGPDNGTLYFDVYKGNDRTTNQTLLPPVIFSEDLDSLHNVSELFSVANAKNVAEVYNGTYTVIVYSDGASVSTTGFGKRTLFVDASDLSGAQTTALTATLTQKGIEELAKNRSIAAFDGEITQLSPYKYSRDYDMGDLLEMRNSNGFTNQMMVTEQIFTSDATGERAYPTLTTKRFITPGSWLSWENSQVWLDALGTWSEV